MSFGRARKNDICGMPSFACAILGLRANYWAVCALKASISHDDLAMLTLKFAAILSALDAIAIGPLPVSWLAATLPIFVAVSVRAKYQVVSLALYLLVLWAALVQGLSLLCIGPDGCTAIQMPPLSTTPYALFIALRFMPFFMMISVLALSGKLRERQDELSGFIVRLGSWIAGIALYVYVAQISGLPDIPRTRLGTDGMEVTTVAFSYSFHRALGTFREPSGMAVWLILPFFLSIRSLNLRTFIMGGAILLSGSMSAFSAIASGALFGALYLSFKSVQNKAWLLRLPIIIALTLLISVLPFLFLVKSNEGYAGLWAVTVERLAPVLSGGIEESNRGYVFQFASDVGLPIIGYGLGNINLQLTHWLGGNAVGGILSLYLNVFMSLGSLGTVLLLVFLARPLLRGVSSRSAKHTYPIFASYFSWLTAFIIHSAEFPIMFALTYALAMGLGHAKSPERRSDVIA